MKKLLTLTLTLLMTFSLCLTISADENNDGDDNSSTVEATIGEKEYTSFVEAFKDLQDGDTLKLEKNVTVTLNDTGSANENSDHSLWSEISNVTLDLNKFTLTTISNYGGSYNVLNVYADGWTVKNGSMIVKRANGKADSYALAVEKENAKLTIDNVSLSGGVAAYDTVVVTLKDTNMGTTEVAATNYYCGYAEGGAKIIINGGTYNSNSSSAVFYAATNSSIEIFGGNFIGSIFCGEENGSLSISGGTFSSDVTKYLTSDVNIAKVGDVYKVTKNGETLEVDETTPVVPAVEEKTIETLKSSDTTITIKSADGTKTTTTVSDTSEIVLSANEITKTDEGSTEPTFTNEEKEEVVNKVVEEVTKEIAAQSKTISANDVGLIPLDVTLKIVTKSSSGQVTTEEVAELSKPITVTLYLNENTLNKLEGKIVKVVRIHDDETTVLPATLTNNALSFETDKFSTYVIAYSSSVSTNTETKSYSSKDKNQDGVISCEEEMNSANWIWSDSKKACVYKVSNTSVR